MKRVVGLVAAVCFGLISGSSSSAGPIHYSARLDGPSEAMPNTSPGIGFATFVFNPDKHTLALNVTFSGLLGNTTAAHIHGPTAIPGTGAASVATTLPSFAGFPLGVTFGSFSNVLNTLDATTYSPGFIANNGGTLAGAEAALGMMLANGSAYLNIHSEVFTGGEIRGFIQPVPEPSSLAIWAVGLIGACGFVSARSQRRVAGAM